MQQLAVAVLLLLPAAWALEDKPCHPRCEEHGNCNRQEGVCKCPMHRKGEACEILITPACATFVGAPNYCEDFFTRSCSCRQQCRETFPRPHNHFCFERTSLPPEEQHSIYPELDEPGVEWYRTADWLRKGREAPTVPMEEARMLNPKEVAYPNSACPDKCSERGYCRGFVNADGKREPPVCMCYFGFEGRSCEKQRPDACFNGCSGNGACFLGFCHCKRGYYGISCAQPIALTCPDMPPHALAWSGTKGGGGAEDARPLPKASIALGPKPRLKIFVYDLPEALAHGGDTATQAWFQYHDAIYVAYRRFTWRLLRDCSVLTDDPEEADLFYVNEFTYGWTSNTGTIQFHIARVVAHLKEHYPKYWNRNQGRDHIFWAPGDKGTCWIKGGEARNAIFLTHYGATAPPSKLRVGKHKFKNCHRHQDIVAPPNLNIFQMLYDESYRGWRAATDKELASGVDLAPMMPGVDRHDGRLFFFAGGIQLDNRGYSEGVRQKVWELHRDEPGFVVAERVDDYKRYIQESTFCLAPSGAGWGIRIVQMIAGGCIPVIIQDLIYQPYEGVLPYWKFSIRMTADEIPDLPARLRAIPKDKIRRMQMEIFIYSQEFNWEKKEGRAYERMLYALQLQLDRIHGLPAASDGTGAVTRVEEARWSRSKNGSLPHLSNGNIWKRRRKSQR